MKKTAIFLATITLIIVLGWLFVPPARSAPASGPFQVVTPYRVLDTRETGLIPAHTDYPVWTGLPSWAEAAAVNITITEPEAAGYVTVWDGRTERPLASLINASGAGDTVANFAIVPLSEAQTFAVYASVSTHLVIDVMGFTEGYTAEPVLSWTPGMGIEVDGRAMQILDGRPEDGKYAPSLIDTCQGAVLYHGEFTGTAWVGAHRTACGDKGFGGIEYWQPGHRVTLWSADVTRTYYLVQTVIQEYGAPIAQPPTGITLVLQTSVSGSAAYLLYFRTV